MENGNSTKGQKHHKFTYTAILIGLVLSAAGLANQFYLAEPLYHPLAGYVLLVPGVAIILRALHPPIGFLRIITTLLGGASLGACPLFFNSDSPNPPWISIGLILVGMAFLGGSFTTRTKMHK
jgi:ABC-type Fe3+-siderophore transport system permease subunit